MEKLISVIIPVYNVAAYLPTCIQSVLSQDYRTLEVVLVDDGSTDGSAEICDAYGRQDSRVKVIHQKNGGAANAKNTGLRAVSGDYLAFVDSDDYLEPGAFRHMASLLDQHDADVVQCSFRDVFANETVDHVLLREQVLFSAEDYLKRYTIDWTCCLLWDKLYRRSLFEGILFEEGHIVDDEFFTYQGIMNAEKIIHDPKIVYNYRKRASSVTAKLQYREMIIFDKLDYLDKRRKKIACRFPKLKETFDGHYLDMLIWLSSDPDVTIDCLRSIKKKIGSYFKEKDHCPVSFRRRCRLLAVQVCSPEKLLSKKRSSQEYVLEKFFM